MTRIARTHLPRIAASLRGAGASGRSDWKQGALALTGQVLPEQCSHPLSYQRS